MVPDRSNIGQSLLQVRRRTSGAEPIQGSGNTGWSGVYGGGGGGTYEVVGVCARVQVLDITKDDIDG